MVVSGVISTDGGTVNLVCSFPGNTASFLVDIPFPDFGHGFNSALIPIDRRGRSQIWYLDPVVLDVNVPIVVGFI